METMKHDIGKQTSLSPMLTFKLTLKGVRDRLFRSIVTVGVICVAVVFMVNVAVESLVKLGLSDELSERVERRRLAVSTATRLSGVGTLAETLAEVSKLKVGSSGYREVMLMTDLSEQGMAEAHAGWLAATGYIKLFGELKYRQRRQLFHDTKGIAVFARLGSAAGKERFKASLEADVSLKRTLELSGLEEFLTAWPGLKASLRSLQAERRRAVGVLRRSLRKRSVMAALGGADGAFGEQVRAAGFLLDRGTAAEVARQSRLLVDIAYIEEAVLKTDLRRLIAGELDLLPRAVSSRVLWRFVRHKDNSMLLLAKMTAAEKEKRGLDPERLAVLAKFQAEGRKLERVESVAAGVGGGFLGIGQRMTLLLLLSIVVSVIGITNAMLMSVTERYRDIATLKCLGALDGFIMLSYVYEGCVLGLAGGIAGAIMGVVVALLRMLAGYGLMVLPSLPLGVLGLLMVVSVVMGVALAALASIYPSMRAARLSPMEAMRVR